MALEVSVADESVLLPVSAVGATVETCAKAGEVRRARVAALSNRSDFGGMSVSDGIDHEIM
jgi:hypothetical protein